MGSTSGRRYSLWKHWIQNKVSDKTFKNFQMIFSKTNDVHCELKICIDLTKEDDVVVKKEIAEKKNEFDTVKNVCFVLFITLFRKFKRLCIQNSHFG